MTSRLTLPGIAVALLPLASRAEDGTGLPLKPTRQVAFDTSEGTWLSPDLSPDGKRIVFTRWASFGCLTWRATFRGRKLDVLVREPSAGNPPARFDERDVETEPGFLDCDTVNRKGRQQLRGTYRHRATSRVHLTVNLADRFRNLLVQHIATLRRAMRKVRSTHPFEILAIMVLPDHLH